MTDPFSYTVFGQPWTAHEWLWELAIYGLYRIGGFALAALVSAAIVTLTYVVVYRLLRRLGVNEFVAVALVVWAAVMAMPSIGVRPREVTALFFAIYLSRIYLYREGSIRTLWLLPLLMLLWVNLHGPFILGLTILGLFVLIETARWLARQAPFPRHLWIVGALTLAATVVNPRGPAMLLYPLTYYTQGSNPSFAVVSEFRSPDFHDPLYLGFGVSLVLLMVLPAGRARRSSHALFDALLLVAFALLALISYRNVPEYALVAAPQLADRLRDRFAIARELSPVPMRPRAALLNMALLAVIVLGAGTFVATQPWLLARFQLHGEPLAQEMPVGGATYIEQHSLPGPVFNEQAWGGYLIYRWYPQRRVFIDGRVDIYGPEVVRDYLELVNVGPSWRQILEKYGIETVLISKGSPLSTLLLASGEWKRVYQGPVEDVFVRRGLSASGHSQRIE